MKGSIDWYKMLKIKRKREEDTKDNLNKENFNNFNIIEDKNKIKKKKTDIKSSFEIAFDRLKQMINNLTENIPSIINEKSFSFNKILYSKFDSQKKSLKEEIPKNIEDNSTKELTIKLENNRKIVCNNYYIEKDDENILNEEIKDENNLFPNLSFINKNCK